MIDGHARGIMLTDMVFVVVAAMRMRIVINI